MKISSELILYHLLYQMRERKREKERGRRVRESNIYKEVARERE